MIKVNTKESQSHPDWKSLKQQPIGLTLEQLHEISKTSK